MEWVEKKRQKEKEKWQRWFAWHPVVIETFNDESRKLVWLETVLKKGKSVCYPYEGER